MVSRAEPSLSGRWWWSIDRVILSALVALMVSGVVLLMAGGPPVAERLGLSTFHFVNRQAVYLVAALTVFVTVSFMTPRQSGARRCCFSWSRSPWWWRRSISASRSRARGAG